ncbi:endosomal/lysosomal proton channel TMEM175 isoform X1 [Erpetoichthys calabaricus]|uniref:Endosomal/lysosomal proton channel TMEM175 n=1 Tax=Erpetoichthys calabaricus TaxID=27687 RepID=A0A8C4SPY1_ERPCA|nr:endosomal/lysosomal proton channel TMEM175 isoform X1 [Erpetoichthys calabaricus]
MAEKDDDEIIEHHVCEEMEKKTNRNLDSHSFLESVTPSEKEGSSSTQSSHRLLAYSDALISIIATVMILPVSHTQIEPDKELQESLQRVLAAKIAVYLTTFLIVTVAWSAHVRLFQVIERIDDFLALLNLACMMLITFLPYTFSLMVTFQQDSFGILLFCCCAIVIGLIQAVIVVYGFDRPHLLNGQIQISENQTFYKYHILKIILRVPVFCFLAGIFSFIYTPLSYVLLGVVIFLPYITHPLKWCWAKAVGHQEEQPNGMMFYSYHPNEPLSKERIESFSDGVYAIVATLLILDICEDNVPDPSKVREEFEGNLIAALSVYGPEFLAYFGSFVTVGLLWFVHHSLFLHITKTTRLMGLLNTFSLAFIGGLPLAYQLTHEFPKNSLNELEAIQISCVIIFFAGIFQLAIWVTALFSEKETLHVYVRYGGKEHAFMFAKLALYPCVTLTTFFLTCILRRFSAQIFHLMEIIVPFAFLALRIVVRIVLALLKLVFCPSKSVHNADDDTRLPFNRVLS